MAVSCAGRPVGAAALGAGGAAAGAALPGGATGADKPQGLPTWPPDNTAGGECQGEALE